VAMKPAEVVVVGGGIVGSSAAYFLAKSGVDVVLIDSRGATGSGGASQACAGGVRHQGRVPAEMPLALYAIPFWKTLAEELEADFQYRQDGMTIVTDEESFVAPLEERVARERSLGLNIRMVYGEDLRNLVPGLPSRMLAGSYCPLDGHADPLRTVNALASAAGRLGARIEWGCPAFSLEREKGRIVAVKTARGDISCNSVVLSAGAWSKALAASAHVILPFHPFPLQMMVTKRCAHALDQVLGWMGHGISLKQVPSGGFVIGGGWPGHGDLVTGSTALMPGSMAKSARTTVELFPSISKLPVIRAWVGIEAFSVDEMQVTGPVPGVDGLFIAAGFSGHGFAIGLGVGALIADFFKTGSLSELLLPFTLDRFGPDVLKGQSNAA
jgi:sarcosine oxidase, subunit beta